MSRAAAHDEPRDWDDVEEVLSRRIAELDPTARQLRAALLKGESPESLGLVEDGLAKVLEERGIS